MAELSDGLSAGNGRSSFDQMVRVIRDVGFPIVVAGFLLWQIPPLQAALQELRSSLLSINETQRLMQNELHDHRMHSERSTVTGSSWVEDHPS